MNEEPIPPVSVDYERLNICDLHTDPFTTARKEIPVQSIFPEERRRPLAVLGFHGLRIYPDRCLYCECGDWITSPCGNHLRVGCRCPGVSRPARNPGCPISHPCRHCSRTRGTRHYHTSGIRLVVSEETYKRLDSLRVDDENDDEITNELINIYETQSLHCLKWATKHSPERIKSEIY
ncbi:DUF7557 family protein [Halorussus limi]|uniref:DUF7557 family protein n=1 Tax=Halorussus limi TaxID=2938695 RepID=UPI003F6058F5